MRRPLILAALIIVQALCALVFLSDILFSILGLYRMPLSWSSRELLEMGAAAGLVLGLGFGAMLMRRQMTELGRAEAKLRRASLDFYDHLGERFDEWQLTPAERDVALFAIKGLSTAEIAQLRATSEGTVKAQTAAIYRKAGVTGRPQLLSLFIEDLMSDERGSEGQPLPRRSSAPPPAA